MDTKRLGQAVIKGTALTVVWGFASAALTRLLMRAVAIVTEQTTEFSWLGTVVGIALLYVLVLWPGAVALAYGAGRSARILFGAGAALLAYRVIVSGVDQAVHARDLSVGQWVGFIATLIAMALVYSAQVVLVYRGARGRRPSRTVAT